MPQKTAGNIFPETRGCLYGGARLLEKTPAYRGAITGRRMQGHMPISGIKLRHRPDHLWRSIQFYQVLLRTGAAESQDRCFAVWALKASKVSLLITCSMRQASSAATSGLTPRVTSQSEKRVWRS